MSIINQALRKAQRERRGTHEGESWVRSAPLGATPKPRRRPALWAVSAVFFVLGLGAVLQTRLTAPAAHLPAALRPVRPVADAAPQSQPLPLTEPPLQTAESGTRALPSAPRPHPTQPHTTTVTAVQPVQLTAARQPTLAPGRYVSQGNDLYRQGRYRGAVDMYQAALALQPGDLKARNNLGTAYMQLAMDDRAIAAFEEVLRLDSTYGLAYYNLACVYARAGNMAEAADFLLRAMEIEPRARDWASTDSDFALVRDTPQFRRHLEP